MMQFKVASNDTLFIEIANMNNKTVAYFAYKVTVACIMPNMAPDDRKKNNINEMMLQIRATTMNGSSERTNEINEICCLLF